MINTIKKKQQLVIAIERANIRKQYNNIYKIEPQYIDSDSFYIKLIYYPTFISNYLKDQRIINAAYHAYTIITPDARCIMYQPFSSSLR